MAQAQAKPEAQSQAQPQVKGGVIPYLKVNGAVKAAEFYKKAFAAEVANVHPPDDKGRTMHAHVYINGGSLMMSDAYPEHGHPLREPAACPKTPKSQCLNAVPTFPLPIAACPTTSPAKLTIARNS